MMGRVGTSFDLSMAQYQEAKAPVKKQKWLNFTEYHHLSYRQIKICCARLLITRHLCKERKGLKFSCTEITLRIYLTGPFPQEQRQRIGPRRDQRYYRAAGNWLSHQDQTEWKKDNHKFFLHSYLRRHYILHTLLLYCMLQQAVWTIKV